MNKMKAANRPREERFADACIGRWIVDVESGASEWSPEIPQILDIDSCDGFTLEDLIQRCEPGLRRHFENTVRGALATGSNFDFEGTFVQRDGAWRALAFNAIGLRGESGNSKTLCVVVRDVSDARREAHFARALLDHIPAMVGYWDRHLKCCYANAAYQEWFGRSADEMLGVSILDLMGPELFALNEPFIRAAMAGKPQTFERLLTKPSGEIGYTLAQYIPDVASDGYVLGMYVLVSDVTALKKAELQLQQANIRLSEAVARAEEAAKAKSDFASNVSHEVRSPLSAIGMFVELLQRSDDIGERGRVLVDRIAEASEALLGTVNNVLDFSQLEEGRIEIDQQPFDPASLGKKALALFAPQAARRHVELRFEAVSLPLCVGDAGRIRQILINLIANAVRFTSKGSVALHASYNGATEVLHFEVIDTGIGIAADKHAKLFRRFVQAEASVARDFGGTGLGLAICDGLAKAMGGAIGLASVVGEGSRFWVDLPCPQAEAPALRNVNE